MALHMLRSTPTFTKAMRGYDIEEVDEYVDALRESEDHQAQTVAEAEATANAMSSELDRLRHRVAELEDCVRSETPRSIAALAERLTLVLEEAEAGAREAVRSATEEADGLLFTAKKSAEDERLMSVARTAESEQRAASRLEGAEEQAVALEVSARRRAEEVVADAEQRALTRRCEIEAWVERVRTHVENEEARAAKEFARIRAIQSADLADLRQRHDQMVAGLVEMGESLARTVESARATVAQEPAPATAARPFDVEEEAVHGGSPGSPSVGHGLSVDSDPSSELDASSDTDASADTAAVDSAEPRPGEVDGADIGFEDATTQETGVGEDHTEVLALPVPDSHHDRLHGTVGVTRAAEAW